MIRKIVVTIVCIATTGIFAQEGTVSPYSFFGIGDLRTAGTVENQMMGGILRSSGSPNRIVSSTGKRSRDQENGSPEII